MNRRAGKRSQLKPAKDDRCLRSPADGDSETKRLSRTKTVRGPKTAAPD